MKASMIEYLFIVGGCCEPFTKRICLLFLMYVNIYVLVKGIGKGERRQG